MDQSRNIVLILGNGFDLDLGLKTSYKDFWESKFCPTDYPAPIISHLNKRWEGHLNAVKWYDLENELLKYYETDCLSQQREDILTKEELDFVRNYSSYQYACHQYDDKTEIIQSLIDKQRIRFADKFPFSLIIPYLDDYKFSIRDRDYIALSLIKSKLCEFLNEMMKDCSHSSSSALRTLAAVNEAKEKGHNASIYSFNYTDLRLAYNEINTKDIHYIHGNCNDNDIIIGTKDVMMPDSSYTFLQKAFNKNFNPPGLVSALRDATDVIIFGHSLGTNDSQYFKDFFEQQASIACEKKRITIITRDDDSEVDIKYALQQLTGTRLSSLFSQNDLSVIKTSEVLDNPKPLRNLILICVGNTGRADALLPHK